MAAVGRGLTFFAGSAGSVTDLKTSFVAAAALAPLLFSAPAFAWATVEHQEIGREAYLGACADLRATVSARKSPDPRVVARLDRACGLNMPVFARLYGDAT